MDWSKETSQSGDDYKTHCGSCRAVLKVKSDAIGKKGRCPKCGKVFKVDEAFKVERKASGKSSSGLTAKEIDELLPDVNWSAECESCKTSIEVTKVNSGSKLVCPSCKESFVPKMYSSVKKKVSKTRSVQMTCPKCRVEFKSNLDGRNEVKCPRCSTVFKSLKDLFGQA